MVSTFKTESHSDSMIKISNHSDSIQFSIIIPLYNKEKSICSTIESVINQTYTNFELIIINDGSTDNSLDKARSFKDKRIAFFDKPNGGVSSARNKGIELSRNELIIFLDADDLWLPYCLEEFIKLLTELPEADVYCTNYNMTGKNLIGSDQRYYVEDYFYTSAFYMAKWSIPIFLTGCVLIKKNLFEKVGFFNQGITHGEDLDMWERLAKCSKIAKSEKVTTIYRTEAENRASDLDERRKLNHIQSNEKRCKILNKSQGLYYGVLSVFELRTALVSGRISNLIANQKIYYNLIIRGLFFILKVRLLKSGLDQHFSTAYNEIK